MSDKVFGRVGIILLIVTWCVLCAYHNWGGLVASILAPFFILMAEKDKK